MAKENDELFQQDLSMFENAMQFVEERQKQLEPDKVEEEEQETEEETKETESTAEDTPSHDTEKSSPLAPYAKLLVDEGVFQSSDIEKWDGTAEGFVKLELEKLEEWKEDYKSSLHPRLKWLQENLEDGVPLKALLEMDERSTSLENINREELETNGEMQKDIARAYYKRTTNFSDQRIEKEIKRLEDSDELRGETSEFLDELLELDKKDKEAAALKAKQEKAEAIKRQQETLNTFKSTLDKTEEVVPGLKVNQIMRDKIYKGLTTVVEVDKETGTPLNKIAKARMEDPINFEIKLAYLFEITNGFKDWSALTTTGKKQAYSNFEAAAKELDKNKGVQRQSAMTSPSTQEFFDAFEKQLIK